MKTDEVEKAINECNNTLILDGYRRLIDAREFELNNIMMLEEIKGMDRKQLRMVASAIGERSDVLDIEEIESSSETSIDDIAKIAKMAEDVEVDTSGQTYEYEVPE